MCGLSAAASKQLRSVIMVTLCVNDLFAFNINYLFNYYAPFFLLTTLFRIDEIRSRRIGAIELEN
jgi:hypothetical protein